MDLDGSVFCLSPEIDIFSRIVSARKAFLASCVLEAYLWIVSVTVEAAAAQERILYRDIFSSYGKYG